MARARASVPLRDLRAAEATRSNQVDAVIACSAYPVGATAWAAVERAPRLVACGDCGSSFELSAQNVRAARAPGEEPLCRECRRPAVAADPAEAERMRRWWLDRYTLDEIRELAAVAGAESMLP